MRRSLNNSPQLLVPQQVVSCEKIDCIGIWAWRSRTISSYNNQIELWSKGCITRLFLCPCRLRHAQSILNLSCTQLVCLAKFCERVGTKFNNLMTDSWQKVASSDLYRLNKTPKTKSASRKLSGGSFDTSSAMSVSPLRLWISLSSSDIFKYRKKLAFRQPRRKEAELRSIKTSIPKKACFPTATQERSWIEEY